MMAKIKNCTKQISRVRIMPLVLMFLLVSLLCGCVKEDLSDCPVKGAGVVLKYRYELNMAYTNIFATEVKKLQTYIFNADGVLVDSLKQIHDANIKYGDGCQIELKPGSYSALTWASDDKLYTDYHISQVNNFLKLSPSDIQIGQTTIDQVRMFLNYSTETDASERATPNRSNFNDLYHGLVEKFTVVDNSYTEVVTQLVKNTNTIKIIIKGLSHLNSTILPSDFDISIRSSNGHYKYDNKIFEKAHNINYLPYNNSIDADSLISPIKTLRLMKPDVDPFDNAKMLLNISYLPGTKEICKDLNVVDLIMSSKIPARDSQGTLILDENGQKIYVQPSLEYLDRQDKFEIKFEIAKKEDGLLIFTVSINDWKITNIYPVK